MYLTNVLSEFVSTTVCLVKSRSLLFIPEDFRLPNSISFNMFSRGISLVLVFHTICYFFWNIICCLLLKIIFTIRTVSGLYLLFFSSLLGVYLLLYVFICAMKYSSCTNMSLRGYDRCDSSSSISIVDIRR